MFAKKSESFEKMPQDNYRVIHQFKGPTGRRVAAEASPSLMPSARKLLLLLQIILLPGPRLFLGNWFHHISRFLPMWHLLPTSFLESSFLTRTHFWGMPTQWLLSLQAEDLALILIMLISLFLWIPLSFLIFCSDNRFRNKFSKRCVRLLH